MVLLDVAEVHRGDVVDRVADHEVEHRDQQAGVLHEVLVV